MLIYNLIRMSIYKYNHKMGVLKNILVMMKNNKFLKALFNKSISFKRDSLIKCFVYMFTILVLPIFSFAENDPSVVQKLQGISTNPSTTTIVNGNICEVQDPIYYNLTERQRIQDVALDKYNNTIALYIDEEATKFIPNDFTYTLTVNITYYDLNENQQTINNVNLTVSYTKGAGLKYDARQYYYLQNARKVTVQIVNAPNPAANTWDPRNVLTLENTLSAVRDYKFNCQEPVIFDMKTAFADELLVKWLHSDDKGATHFDVEWAWVDEESIENYKTVFVAGNAAELDARLIFTRNATRITLLKSVKEYKIPLLYDGRGYLFYRVRPVQYKENGDIYEGIWNVTNIPNANDYYIFDGHQNNQFNWQASTSYAEEGKRKTVVQYFDGTLRSRQTVTKDNSQDDKTTVVAETYYDYQGRPVINILPTPTLNTVLEYARNFNRFVGQTAANHPKDMYDALGSSQNICNSTPLALDNTQGASQYYSVNNAMPKAGVNAFNQFIPDAQGFPYTETRYKDDATNRIAEQSGVGSTHKLGTGHQTKYYYGSAAQEELDPLFGVEVGEASHYFKNMVVDANGQVSVSYVDMHGRTVATALAGESPNNVEPLPSLAPAIKTITKNLLTPVNNVVKDRSIVSSSSLLVSSSGMHTFAYNVNPLSAEIIACNPQGETVCYDCYYTLNIKVTDACGNIFLDETRNNLTFNNGNPVYDVQCSTQVAGISVTFNPILLPIGEYNVTKILTVSKPAQDWYRENLFKTKNFCKTLESIKTEILAKLTLESDCATMSCATCTTAVGPTFDDFKIKYLKALFPPNGTLPQGFEFTAAQLQEIQDMYDEAIENCSVLCEATETELDDIEDEMLQDVMPEMGQYARVDVDINSNGNTTDVIGNAPEEVYESGSARNFNILERKHPVSTHVAASAPLPYFQYPKDENGNTIVFKTRSGEKDMSAYLPNNQNQVLGKEAFVDNFKDEWAQQLLYYHPEYPKLQYAKNNLLPSYTFNRNLEDIETWADASTPALAYTTFNGLIDKDPFFTLQPGQTGTAPGAAYKNTMVGFLNTAYTYPGFPATATSLWKTAYLSVVCTDVNTEAACIASAPSYPGGTYWANLLGRCEADKDYIWQALKTLYLSLKNDFVTQLLDTKIDPALNTAFNNPLYKEGFNKCQRRFPRFEQFLSPASILEKLRANPTKEYAEEQLAQQYQENCESYIDFWKNELEACKASNPLITTTIINQITATLKNICIEGSDISHPLGSSSVRPASTNVNPNRRFEDAIEAILSNNGISVTSLCHPFMISNPRPYESQPPISDDEVDEQKDECLCNNLEQLKTKMIAKGYNTAPATLPTNMKQFLQTEFKIEIDLTLLTTLINGCTIANATCNTYNPPLEVPGFLTDCKSMADNCITCTEYNTQKQQFITRFPMFTGIIYQETTTPLTAEQLRQNEAFAAYMNNKNGFNKTWHEYLQFESTCNSSAQQNPGANCGLLTTILSNYQTYYHTQPAYTIAYNSDGCDISSWNFSRTPPVIFKNLFVNGVVSAPGGKFQFDYPHDICITDEFTITYRIKPLNTAPLSQIYLPLSLKYGTTNTVFYLWMNNGSGVVQAGAGNPQTSVPGLSYTPHINQWVNVAVKFRPSDGYVWVYVNGSLVHDGNTNFAGISRINTISIQSFVSMEMELDRVTINNNINGDVIFDEDFNNACSSFSIINPKYDCAKVDCNGYFVNYFNPRYNPPTVYTFAQIQALYASCGISLTNPCNPGILPTGPLLCGRLQSQQVQIEDEDPCDYLEDMALDIAMQQYNAYVIKQNDLFDNTYLNKCLEARNYETLTVTSQVAEYHYTLYYYDQAGNLVKTVPPKGVNPDYTPTFAAAVKNARDNNLPITPALVPPHNLVTNYRYNSLNQVVAQISPDGGLSRFWYDALGRLAVSQNEKQKGSDKYSYTIYDALGRIKEVGQKPSGQTMTQAISQSASALYAWIYDGIANKEQITRTTYDVVASNIMPPPANTSFTQKELRNRVSYTQVFETDPDLYIEWPSQPGDPIFTHTSATYYTYDIHGNVDVLLQDYKENFANEAPGNRFKTIHYKYDLISGKVNEVAYQPGMIDAFYHRYDYDAENKLVKAQTSKDKLYWEDEAQYKYYRHGPLARSVLGKLQVQGLDYAYTIQGWLKGVNSTAIQEGATGQNTDMGQDGLPFVTPPTPPAPPTGSLVARDAFSLSLNYFNNDYAPIVNTVTPFANILATGALPGPSSDGLGAANPLYNGNIAAMAVNIPKLGTPMVYGYKYDQLNRIVRMNAYNGLNNATNTFTAAALDEYKERVSYDANGNILTYLRNATTNRLLMDNLTYNYKPDNNQLDNVTDAAADAPNNEYSNYNDIKQGQAANNYTYDEIGNLITDASEHITNIEWNVYGKIKSISKTKPDNTIINIEYTYDASGNRISKTVATQTANYNVHKTFYVRDASGNVMSVYEKTEGQTSSNLTQIELHMYGSSRLGIVNTSVDVSSGNIAQPVAGITTFTRGNKFFELSNHLGNVLVTITDKKLVVIPQGSECLPGTAPAILNVYIRNTQPTYVAGQEINFLPNLFASAPNDQFEAYIDPNLPNCVPPTNLPAGSYFMADVVAANDYYPFGMNMPERKYSLGNSYRYGFNGKERDNSTGEGNLDFGARVMDVRLGKWLSIDPLVDEYPSVSPYNYSINNPIYYIDRGGMEPEPYYKWKHGGWTTPEKWKKIQGSTSHIHVVNFGNLYGDDHNYVAIRDNKIKDKWWYATYDQTVSPKLGVLQKTNWRLYNPKTKKYESWTPDGWIEDEKEIIATAQAVGKFGEVCESVVVAAALIMTGAPAVYAGISAATPTAITLYGTYAGTAANITNNYLIPLLDESGQAGNASAVVETALSKIAFGFDKQARSLASKIGGSHLMDVKGDWKGAFLSMINNLKTEIHFSLDNFEGSVMSNILNPSRSNTNWELNTLYQNKEAFERTIFHVGDKTYTGSEVFTAPHN
jgi:RHS repeat-associated protein